jgi:hypothetical protein
MLNEGDTDGREQERRERKEQNDANLNIAGVKVRAMEEIARFFEK